MWIHFKHASHIILYITLFFMFILCAYWSSLWPEKDMFQKGNAKTQTLEHFCL